MQVCLRGVENAARKGRINMEMNTMNRSADAGLWSLWHSTPQFKTMRLSAHLVLPLESAEASAARAIVPNISVRATRRHPDYTAFGRYLASLYGADVHAGVSRVGDNQILTLATTGIAGRYAFGGEDMQKALAEILENILFEPLFDADGQFSEEGFRQEKRQLLETLDAEFNEKRIYAKNRCAEIMFAGEPAGIPQYGTKAALQSVSREAVKAAWEQMLQHAGICQFFIGDGANAGFDARMQNRLGTRDTAPMTSKAHVPSETVKTVVEEQPLAQSKLVMGFGFRAGKSEKLAEKLAAVVFGGTPSAKLFLNVRERESLCYYCSARHDTPKNVVFVESGVETANIERAQEAILRELGDMRGGKISDEELLHAKLAMCNSYHSVADSAAAMEGWYLAGMLADDVRAPEACAEQIMQMTKEQVVDAAERMTLDTVYILKGASAEA